MFIHLQIGEKIVTPRVRLFEPLNLMKQIYNIDYEILDKVMNFKKEGERFLIRSRIYADSFENALQLPSLLYNNNYLLLYEIDDSNKRFREYNNMKYVDFFASHAITCSTEPLADELSEFNPFVKVFKNQIANFLPEKNFEEKDHITIFFGALNRSDCWQDIMPILNKFAKKYGDKLHFMVISDRKFFDALETPHKLFPIYNKFPDGQFIPYDVYMRELQKADIALLPLIDTPFNRAKSDLKFIEAGNASVAVLASPTVYENSVKDGQTGFIYRTPREFQAKLNILLKDKAKRIEIAKAAHEYVRRERLLKDHIAERFDWLCETYQRHEELQKALLTRIDKHVKK